MATLQVAVVKRARIIIWRLRVVDALESAGPVPPPPNILINRREAALYSIYVEQRRLLHGSVTWAPEGFSSDKQSVGHNAAVAYAELEHWKLGSEALPADVRHEIPIDIDEEMSRLSALAGFAPLLTLESDTALRLATEADVSATLPFDFTRPALDLRRLQTNRRIVGESVDPLAQIQKRLQTNERTDEPTTAYDAWVQAMKGHSYVAADGSLVNERRGVAPRPQPAGEEAAGSRLRSERPIIDDDIEAEMAFADDLIRAIGANGDL